MLTKLEDQILLTVWKLRGKAYGVNVYQHLQEDYQVKVAVGVVYFALDRLTRRDCLESYKGEPTAVRGGMRKKYYKITDSGIAALAESKKMIDCVWGDYSNLAIEMG